MPFWRRKKPLHEKLAEEGGLVPPPPPHDTTPRWGEAGIHGVHRPREWDATAVVEAPDLEGDELEFVALPDGTLLVDGEEDPAPLADALETSVESPYRARAVRQTETAWAVAARRIEVVELSGDVDGDALELTVHDGERTFLLDGRPEFGSVPELEQLAAAKGFESYAIRALRLDGRLWEVQVSPL